MKNDSAFEYGGYHFIPERKLTPEENDFAEISRKLRIDSQLGFCIANYAYPSKHPYARDSFYAAATDKTCDLFRCVENGKLYIPCENDLQEYDEHGQSRNIEALRELVLPVYDRLMMQRFPSTYREVPEGFISFVVEDVFNDSAWRTEGAFSEDDVSLAIQNEIMICVHEILGKQPTQRYRQQEQNTGRDPIKLDQLDIEKMSPLTVSQDIDIGDRSVLLGKIGSGKYSGQYVSCYRHQEKVRFVYTDVTISGDYFEALNAFAQHIQDQADRTRIQITAPFFDGINLETIDRHGCKELSEDDNLVGKVVVIRADVLRPEYQHSTYQLRLCGGGFGAYPHSRGSACFCKSLMTGEEGRFERDEILGTIEPETLPMWAKQKLDAIQQQDKKKNRKGDAR